MVTLATVSQKATQRKRVVLAREQQQGQFFNVHLVGPVAWGARYRGNRRAVRHGVLDDAGVLDECF